MSGEEMGVEEARYVDPEMEPGPPCGICGDPEWEPITPWKSNFHEGDHEFVPVEIANRIRASERAAVLAEVEALHEHTYPECYGNYNDPTHPYCGKTEATLTEVIARIRNGGKA